jgi:hypothetical protein
LATASVVLLGAVLIIYVQRFLQVLKPSALFQIYEKVFTKGRVKFDDLFKVGDDIKKKKLAKLNKNQLEKWKSGLSMSIIFNRVCLFSAKRLKVYQSSGVHVISGIMICIVMMFLTITSFAEINFAIYKIDPTNFEATSDRTSFSFFYYSFNIFVFNFIKEIVPVGTLAHSAFMLEASFAILLVVMMVASVIPFRNERYLRELNGAIASIEQEGRAMEAFIRREYRFRTIDEAILELQRLEAAMIRFVLFLSDGIKDEVDAEPRLNTPAR